MVEDGSLFFIVGKGSFKMTNSWAAPNFSGSSDLFESVHSGLRVSQIATPRNDLKTCRPDEQVENVLRRNAEFHDHIPVVDESSRGNQHIIGLFHAADFHGQADGAARIRDNFIPLSEEYIIGADSSILDFIKEADTRPCRLLVSNANITGLVSLSDLQRLPVRVTLFALITGLEIIMMDAIRRSYKNELDWMNALGRDRSKKVEAHKKKAEATDAFVDSLLFTQFADKKVLIKKKLSIGRSKPSPERVLGAIERLRNKVAHANEYANTPSKARNVCKTVREMLQVRLEIGNL